MQEAEQARQQQQGYDDEEGRDDQRHGAATGEVLGEDAADWWCHLDSPRTQHAPDERRTRTGTASVARNAAEM